MTAADDSKNNTPRDSHADALGYSAYAETLWARIQQALNQDDSTHPLGDDPLVVGIFGEWGAGKSHLLGLIRAQALKLLAEQKKSRENDPGFTLTVPVTFQPWRYEHEPHLQVPLLLHVINALKDALREPPSVTEHAAKAVATVNHTVQAVAKPTGKLLNVATTSFPLVQKILSAISIFGVKIDLPDELGEWLESAAESADGISGDETKDSKRKDVTHQVPTASNDGLMFYRVHELLAALTRPGAYEKRKDLFGNANVTKSARVNFVVFIDDLDRCLPEKAVATLELIKTVFNVESFAFVLALDEEIIERGIGHRYSAYVLKDKKPQMPITGFEYLEKIVHLPFRIPALTAHQARAFVQKIERNVAPEAGKHWFDPWPNTGRAEPTGALKTELSEGSDGAATRWNLMPAPPVDTASPLLAIVVACFDGYVPRKLLRTVELWHQVCRVAVERGVASGDAPATHWSRRVQEGAGRVDTVSLDTRVVFALVLLQLFQPELFRFMRRRVEAFPVLLGAFSGAAGGLGRAELADVDLWHWATCPQPIDSGAKTAVPDRRKSRPHSEASAVACIAALGETSAERERAYQAQFIRLRIAERLVEHFAAQRHAFNPLKLMHVLAQQLGDAAKVVARAMPSYFSVLAEQPEVEVTSAVGPNTDTSARPTLAIADVDALFAALTSVDPAARGGIAERFALTLGHVLPNAVANDLATKFRAEVDTTRSDLGALLQRFDAVETIAPWLDWKRGGRTVFAAAVGHADDKGKPFDFDTWFKTASEPKVRAAMGDALDALADGDPRFVPETPWIWASRHGNHDKVMEPIPGFVRVPAGKFTMGHKSEKSDNAPTEQAINYDFYIARSHTTVAQYARFVDDGGYTKETFWSPQGWRWRNGDFTSKVEEKVYADWLKRRPKERRGEPWDWAVQQGRGNRPVTGVCWFEARAYAAWLTTQLQAELATLPRAGYEVRLPTEPQWERAARAGADGLAHAHRWPWGSEEKDAAQRANVNQTIGHVTGPGVYAPNPLGLYDMAGNAWHWMDNLYQPAKGETFSSVGRDQTLRTAAKWEDSDSPALRGGSWIAPPESAACSYRSWSLPGRWGYDVGFRVVLSLAKSEA